MTFSFTPEQAVKIRDWLALQNQEVRVQQQAKIREKLETEQDPLVREGLLLDLEMAPYTGAIGGVVTYSFTPTSLGVVVKVSHCMTKQELDVTEYDTW